TSLLDSPSAIRSTICARRTKSAGKLCERAIDSSCARFSLLTINSFARRPGFFGIEHSSVQRYNLDSARYAKLHTGHHTSEVRKMTLASTLRTPLDTDPRDFSIILGGPLFQLLRRAHMTGDALELLRRRIVVISLVAWLPLLLLSLLHG